MGIRANSGPAPTAGGVRDQRRAVALIDRGDVEALRPGVPKQWSLATVAAWETFWSSDLIAFVGVVDLPGLQRLFTYYDLWTKTYEKWMSEVDRFGVDELLGVTEKGRAVVSPHLLSLEKLEQLTLRLEERFGITPLVRARLGIRFAQAVQEGAKADAVPRKPRPGAA